MGATSKVVIKVNFNGEFKRISVDATDMTFDAVVQHVMFLFPALRGKPFSVRYQDEEGDLITCTTDNEVQYAIDGSNVLRLVVTEGLPADEADHEHFEQVEAPMVRVSAPEITEEMMVKLSFESAHLEVPAQGHLVLFLDGHEIRRWMEPSGTVLLAELPAGLHEFGVAIAVPEGQIVSQAATVAFALEAVAPMPPALEPKVFMHPSTLPPDLLKFDIKIEDFDLSAGHAVVLLNERPAAVICEAQSCIVLKDLPAGRNCMQVRFVDANGQMLPEGGQAVFDMPNLAPVAPAAPKIYFDSPSSSGEDVLVKFEIADYDVARDGPASIVLDSRLKALTIENPCTLVLQDLTAGQHEVIVELPMRQIDGSIRFHVVRPAMPSIVLLQPVVHGTDKLLMRFELDAPLPSGALVDAFINGKLAGSFQQNGCIVIDKPIKVNYTFRVAIRGTDNSRELTVVL